MDMLLASDSCAACEFYSLQFWHFQPATVNVPICHLGLKPEIHRATLYPENTSGSTMRMRQN